MKQTFPRFPEVGFGRSITGPAFNAAWNDLFVDADGDFVLMLALRRDVDAWHDAVFQNNPIKPIYSEALDSAAWFDAVTPLA